MFERIANSWELVKASARVLQQDKELLVFPILSMIGVLVVTASFIVPFIFGGMLDSITGDHFQIGGFLVLAAYYIVQYAVIFFANTALVGAAMIRLNGGDPTVRDGLEIAVRNLPAILGYSVIAATVGVILRSMTDRSKGFGRFVISVIGTAWNVATFLVVPVLAVEGVGPIEAIKRSISLLKKTWGEQIAGNFGLGAITFFAVLAVILVGAVGVFGLIAINAAPAFFVVFIGVMVLLLVFVGLISSTLSSIYTSAVYQYATTGETTSFFDDQLVQQAFRQKR
jgi:Family of unknown function (DUF6159)